MVNHFDYIENGFRKTRTAEVSDNLNEARDGKLPTEGVKERERELVGFEERR